MTVIIISDRNHSIEADHCYPMAFAITNASVAVRHTAQKGAQIAVL